MELSHTQKLDIRENGYTIVRGVIPAMMVNAAVKAINHSLGQGMPPDQVKTYAAQSYCPELVSSPVITDLFNATPLPALLESVLGADTFGPVKSGQIALRFPTLQDPAPWRAPHLDGIHTPTNGVPEGPIRNFTSLVGVLLSDLPEGNAGNLMAWPGTHQKFAEYFREHGTSGIMTTPKIDLPEPRQITGRAGDVVVSHYQLGHAVTPNSSPHIRYSVYFRIIHRDHETHRQEVLADIWRDRPGIRAMDGK
jgi:hypothetical protein